MTIEDNAGRLAVSGLIGYVDRPRGLLWNREGETRYIPFSKLRNHVQAYQSWLQISDNPVKDIPLHVLYIYWEDCLVLPESSSKVNVSL